MGYAAVVCGLPTLFAQVPEIGAGAAPTIIFIAAIFTNNILLSNFLGMCSFLAISKQIKASIGLGLAVTFVLTMTSALNWALNSFVLVPLGLEYLQFITFIIVIAAFVQFVEIIIERFSPALYFALGIFLPLITVNCAILGVSLFMIVRNYTFARAVAYGVGSGLGWMLAIVAIAGIRYKLRFSNVPKPLEGIGITMILAGLMAFAFMGFAGMVDIK
ncbi:MAG: NADH:ubiquinone reductase (Na(+)-transporting) subunit E [Verrucomicrobia bacterium]|nr:NADH:ubiquinone reductase (Na(+)-transporting) subunit E [Verrucomicrobiota bacterium]